MSKSLFISLTTISLVDVQRCAKMSDASIQMSLHLEKQPKLEIDNQIRACVKIRDIPPGGGLY